MNTLPGIRAIAVSATAFLLSSAPGVRAGDGKFDGTELTLHVYFAKKRTREELIGTDSSNFTGSWKDYFRQASNRYYDSHEGLSRIKRIYLYNALPDGVARSDVKVDQSGPSANPNSLGLSGRYVYLPENFKNTAFSSAHSMMSFAHELGHYLYGILDSYGGQIEDSAGVRLPLEVLTAAQQTGPFTAAKPDPSSLNFRTYMWGDQWLRARVGAFAGQTLTGPALYGGPVFYEPTGRLSGGVYPNGSLMSTRLGSASVRDCEFSTPASHHSGSNYTFRMPSYNTGSGTRPADSTAQTYTLKNEQHAQNGKSEWTMVEESGLHNLTVPTGQLATQALSEALMPEVILVGGAAVVLCIDVSGSMSSENRMALAQSGANAALSQFRIKNTTTGDDGHFSGLVSFDDVAVVNVALQELVNEGVRGTIRSAVNALAPDGSTSIGGGLRTSLNEVISQTDKTKAIILLSDGAHNSGESPASVIPDLRTNDVKVYTIALGSSADTSTLGSIATQTGGEMRATTTGNDLTQFFTDLMAKLNNAGSTTSSDITIQKGQTYQESSYVESGANRVVFQYKSNNPAVKPTLRTPKGKTITPTSNTPGVTFVDGQQFDSFELNTPEAGNWRLSLSNPRTAGTTGGLGQFSKTETPALIINDSSTVTSQLSVNSSGTVAGLQVGVDITHTYQGDLRVTLISPSGARIRLHSNTGGGTDNIVGTYGANLTSLDSLGLAAGTPAMGNWTLEIMDTSSGDTGVLNSWFIKFVPLSSSGAADLEVTVSTQNNSITVDASASPQQVAYPSPVKLTANVSALGASVAGASVFADVYTPEGSHFYLPLYDDGRADHGDAAKSDGSYNVLFDSFSRNGSYTFVVSVINKSGWAVNTSDFSASGLSVPRTLIPIFERTVTTQCTVTGVPVTDIQQFTMDYFSSVNSATAGADSFEMRGTFNSMPFTDFNGLLESFTFRVGSSGPSYSIVSGGWKRVGRLQKYTRTVTGESAVFNYFLGGSSKCSYTYKRSKTTLDAGLVNPPDTALIVTRSGHWTETVNVMLDSVGAYRRYSGKHTQPDLFVSTTSCTLSKTRKGQDSLTFSARAEGPFVFDPLVNGINLRVGPFNRNIAPGAAHTKKGSILTYKSTSSNNGTVTVTYDIDKQLLRATATKEDLSIVATQPLLPISVELTGVAGASWTRKLGLAPNASKTIFRY